MNCFALTSRSEGMPQAVLEAAIAGLPIVATRVGGLPELIDDGRTGILIEPNDPAMLTQAILAVLSDTDAARRWAMRRDCESNPGFTSGRWPRFTIDISSRYSDESR